MFDDYKIIDLSQEIYEGMPVYDSNLPTKRTIVQEHGDPDTDSPHNKSFYLATLLISEHSGTHVDAISHIDPRPNAPHVNEMGLEYFCGKGIAIDFDDVGDNQLITLEQVKNRLEFYNVSLKDYDIFLYTSGHFNKYYPTDEYHTKYSGLSQEAAEYIYNECDIKNIGTDAPSVDKYGSEFPCHFVCKKYGKSNTENLCNIDKLLGKSFFYVGLPLKIRQGSGSPIRAVAFVK